MNSKSIFASKTLWLNLLGPVFTLLAGYGLNLTPDQQLATVTIIMAGANAVMRLFTKDAVHVVPPQAVYVLFAVAFGGLLAACSSTGQPIIQPLSQTDLTMIFKNACAGVSVADGAFKAASPALVASGKLTQAQVAQEASIVASVQPTCANPPADLATAGVTLVGDAAAIYLLVAPPLGS